VDDDISGVQISTPNPAAVAAAAVAVSWHCHLDDVRCEPREVVPPRGRETAGRGVLAVAPYNGADPRGVGEWAVVDEVHAAAASNPVTGGHTSLHGLQTQPQATSLGKRDHTVVAAEVVVEHMGWTPRTAVPFRGPAISAR